ncbi:MAG: hypothetical protein KAH20_13005 [Methylococcales bacterium]|nr:hypothetical protein [Methylococcales bacterium]
MAGDLKTENVCSVLKELKPFGFDVSSGSGIEINGVKI